MTQASRAYEAAPIQITKEVNAKKYQVIMLMISSKKNKWRKRAKRVSKMKNCIAKKKNRKKEDSKTIRRAKIVLYKCNSRLIKSRLHLNKIKLRIRQKEIMRMITNQMKMQRLSLW